MSAHGRWHRVSSSVPARHARFGQVVTPGGQRRYARQVTTTLGRFIRTRREELGLDQALLAGAVGVGQQTVSRWERGDGPPRRRHLGPLAGALKIDGAELHRLAGYQPDAPSTPADELVVALRQRADEMTDQQLLDILDIVWRTYRSRSAPVT